MSELELLLVNEADNCTIYTINSYRKQIASLNVSITNSRMMRCTTPT